MFLRTTMEKQKQIKSAKKKKRKERRDYVVHRCEQHFGSGVVTSTWPLSLISQIAVIYCCCRRLWQLHLSQNCFQVALINWLHFQSSVSVCLIRREQVKYWSQLWLSKWRETSHTEISNVSFLTGNGLYRPLLVPKPHHTLSPTDLLTLHCFVV